MPKIEHRDLGHCVVSIRHGRVYHTRSYCPGVMVQARDKRTGATASRQMDCELRYDRTARNLMGSPGACVPIPPPAEAIERMVQECLRELPERIEQRERTIIQWCDECGEPQHLCRCNTQTDGINV